MSVKKVVIPPTDNSNKELRRTLDRIKKLSPNTKPAKKEQKQVLKDKYYGEINPHLNRHRGEGKTTSVKVVRKDHQ